MNKYSFSNSDKKILWGEFDSDFFFDDIKKFIENDNDSKNQIELDFEGIKSMDCLFIQNVFIKLVSSFGDNNKKIFIFNNIGDNSIVYYLNKSFRQSKHKAYIKMDEDLKSIGYNLTY